MGDYQVISKGYYSYPQNTELISVKQFMFALQGDSLCLLLRFENNNDDKLTSLRFALTELDSKGNRLKEQIIYADKLDCRSKETLTFDQDIFVHDNCTDFKIQFLEAGYGDFTYSFKKDNVAVTYNSEAQEELSPEIEKSMGGKKKVVIPKNFKISGLLCILTAIIVGVALLATWFQLKTFMSTASSFSLENVEYLFLDEDKEHGRIAITSYTGYEQDIVIPETVEGLTIARIDKGAFTGKTINSIKISSNVEIGDGAFEGCTSLTNIDLGATERIGKEAFKGCTSLKSIYSNCLTYIGDSAFENCTGLEKVDLVFSEEDLTMGSLAFMNCTSLKDANFNRYIKNENDEYDFLKFDTEIINLTLQDISSFPTLSELFGYKYSSGRTFPLKNLNVAYMENIPNYFFYGFNKLQKLTIAKLKTGSVGESAFYNCTDLHDIIIQNETPITSIQNYAFYNSGITSFEAKGLTTLGASAFGFCTSLTSVDLSDSSLTSITESQFAGCSSLTNFEFPENCTTIERLAFNGCASLQEMIISDDVTSIGFNAFGGCASLSYMELPFIGGSVNSNSYLSYIFGAGSNTSLNGVVPSSLKSISINKAPTIGKYAFYGVSGIESIEINDKPTMIDNYAFANCTSLKSFDIADSVTEIGTYAFSNSGITELVIPKTVTKLNYAIFKDCKSLRELTLPFIGLTKDATDANTTFISYLFGGTKATTSGSSVPSALKEITILDGTFVLKNAFYGLTGLDGVILADSITSIGERAFYSCTGLSYINLPENLETIEKYAFNMAGIEILTLPSTLTTIREYAFCNSGLKEVNFSGSVDTIEKDAFASTKLESLVMPNVTNLGENAFSNNSYLTNVTFREDAANLGSYTFSNCTALKNISVPNSIEYIGRGVLQGCSALETISLPFLGSTSASTSDAFIGWIFGANSALQNIAPNTLTNVTLTNDSSIENRAFVGCSGLKTVRLNDGISKIGDEAFANCTSLKLLYIPSSVAACSSTAFTSCYKLIEVYNLSTCHLVAPSILAEYKASDEARIPSQKVSTENYTLEFYKAGENFNNNWYLVDYSGDVTNIELPQSFNYGGSMIKEYVIISYFAYGNSALTNMSVSSSVKEIGKNAFYGNNNLTNLSFVATGSKLTTVGDGAFAYCTNLKTAELPSSVKTIGSDAFISCSSLFEVYAPQSLESIGDDAFKYCENLIDIFNVSNLPIELGEETYGYIAYYGLLIHNNLKDKTLHEEKIGNYNFKTNDTVWILMELDNIGSSITFEKLSFDGKPFTYRIASTFHSDTITSVTMTDGVNAIRKEIFANCTNLQSVDMSQSTITSIPDYAFYSCEKLESIILPETVKTVGSHAFAECKRIKEIDFADGVTSIGQYAFANCYSLEGVNLTQISVIPSYAFQNCYRLFEFNIPSIVTSIEEGAFRSCYALTTITVPESVVSIGTNAFLDCSNLSDVYNLSTLPIEKAKSTYGNIAYFANRVFTNASETPYARAMKVKSYGDTYYFVRKDPINQNWYLYSIPSVGTSNIILLPEQFTGFDSANVSMYEISKNALTYNFSIVGLLIPSNVTKIATGALDKVQNLEIYTKETSQAKWNEKAATNAVHSTTAIFYFTSSCVHEDGLWTYDNTTGLPSHQVYEKVLVQTIPGDCLHQTQYIYECPKCHERETIYEDADHVFNADHVCTACGYTFVNSTNINSLSWITNDSQKPFTATADNTIKSSTKNAVNTVTRLTITATRTMKVQFSYRTSCEDNDILTIQLNKHAEVTASGNMPAPVEFAEITMNAGDILEFVYTKDNKINSYDDCIYIYNLKIKEI